VRELLNLPHADGSLLKPWPVLPDTCTLFTRLLELSDKNVLRVLTFQMAESLPALVQAAANRP
jgi:hypothetical protein